MSEGQQGMDGSRLVQKHAFLFAPSQCPKKTKNKNNSGVTYTSQNHYFDLQLASNEQQVKQVAIVSVKFIINEYL